MISLLGDISKQEYDVLVEILQKCEYKNGKFDHRAHLTLGFYFVVKYRENAFEKIKNFILGADKFAGIPVERSFYHETLTIFWTKVLTEFVLANKITALTAGNIDLLFSSSLANKDLIFEFYSKPLIYSTAAKEKFINPDLNAGEIELK